MGACEQNRVISIAGIETMHMVKKGQLGCPGGLAFSTADYF